MNISIRLINIISKEYIMGNCCGGDKQIGEVTLQRGGTSKVG